MLLHSNSFKFRTIHDAAWCFIKVLDISWWLMKLHYNSWQFMTIHEDSWWLMKIHENLWWLMTLQDNSWRFMMIHENLWKFVTVYDNSWQFMTIHDNSWQARSANSHPGCPKGPQTAAYCALWTRSGAAECNMLLCTEILSDLRAIMSYPRLNCIHIYENFPGWTMGIQRPQTTCKESARYICAISGDSR